jgi:plastocyanin
VAIKMQNIAFDPKDVTVKVGQKVTWTNDDSVDHNVTADSGADFKSKDFGKGATFEFTATKAGKITYECTLHPSMKGATITVQ